MPQGIEIQPITKRKKKTRNAAEQHTERTMLQKTITGGKQKISLPANNASLYLLSEILKKMNSFSHHTVQLKFLYLSGKPNCDNSKINKPGYESGLVRKGI